MRYKKEVKSYLEIKMKIQHTESCDRRQKQLWKFIAINTYIKKLDLKQETTKKSNKLSPKLAEGRNCKDQHRNKRAEKQ